VSAEVAVTMSATVDSPRSQRTFISRSSAWVSVMDLFGGIEINGPRNPFVDPSSTIGRSTNHLVAIAANFLFDTLIPDRQTPPPIRCNLRNLGLLPLFIPPNRRDPGSSLGAFEVSISCERNR
jgi:hypothetical protein